MEAQVYTFIFSKFIEERILLRGSKYQVTLLWKSCLINQWNL